MGNPRGILGGRGDPVDIIVHSSLMVIILIPFWSYFILVLFHFGLIPFWSQSFSLILVYSDSDLVLYHSGLFTFWSDSSLALAFISSLVYGRLGRAICRILNFCQTSQEGLT